MGDYYKIRITLVKVKDKHFVRVIIKRSEWVIIRRSGSR